MNVFQMILDGLGKVRDIVIGVRDARRANVHDALEATEAGHAAHDAAKCAGHESEPRCKP